MISEIKHWTKVSEDFYKPESGKLTCQICHIADNTGHKSGCSADLDSTVHKGFTIGNGTKLYWMILWHGTGNCTVFRCGDDAEDENGILKRRWIDGGTEITIHWK